LLSHRPGRAAESWSAPPREPPGALLTSQQTGRAAASSAAPPRQALGASEARSRAWDIWTPPAADPGRQLGHCETAPGGATSPRDFPTVPKHRRPHRTAAHDLSGLAKQCNRALDRRVCNGCARSRRPKRPEAQQQPGLGCEALSWTRTWLWSHRPHQSGAQHRRPASPCLSRNAVWNGPGALGTEVMSLRTGREVLMAPCGTLPSPLRPWLPWLPRRPRSARSAARSFARGIATVASRT